MHLDQEDFIEQLQGEGFQMKDIMALQRAGLQGSHYLLFVFFVWFWSVLIGGITSMEVIQDGRS